MANAELNSTQTVPPARGIICPHCGGNRSRVVYTRAAEGGILRRRRQCLRCGQRILTVEQISG